MNVVTSGIFVSSLLFEQANSIGDLDGLLIGHTSSYTSQSIDDDSMDKIHFQKIYYIDVMIPALHLYDWYKSDGSLNTDGLNAILQNTNKMNVIGWFKSRRQTSLIVSFREHLIHTNLQNWYHSLHGQDSPIIFMLVSTQSVAPAGEPGSMGGLLTIDYQFLINENTRFINVASSIKNLGCFAKADYRNISEIPAQHDEQCFQSTIEKHKTQFCEKNEDIKFANHIEVLSNEMATKFEKLASELKKSEIMLQSLYNENEQLKTHLQMIKEEKRRRKIISSQSQPTRKEENLMDLEESNPAPIVTSTQSVERILVEPSLMDTGFIDEDFSPTIPAQKRLSKDVNVIPSSPTEGSNFVRETRSRNSRKPNGKSIDFSIS